MDPKWSSRKYKAAWYLTALSTTLLVGPYLVSLLFKEGGDIITGDQYLWFLFGIWGAYFGMNVAEKGKYFQPKQTSKIDNPDEE